MTAHSLALHHVTVDVQRRDRGRRIGRLRVLKDCNRRLTDHLARIRRATGSVWTVLGAVEAAA